MNLDPKTIMAWVAVASFVGGGLKWSWNLHSEFLTDALSPIQSTLNGINRASLAQRLRNYRTLQCDGSNWTDTLQEAMDEADLQYQEIVGRRISVLNQPCSEFLQ